jgi:hypothetical protein
MYNYKSMTLDSMSCPCAIRFMWVVELNRGICRRPERGRDGRIAGGIGNIGWVSGENVGSRLARRFSRC